MAFCHEAMDCQARPRSWLLPYGTKPFPVTPRSPSQDVCCHQPTHLIFSTILLPALNGQVYRRLFATEVLEERPLSTAFWTSCHWLFHMDNVLFCFSIGRTRWASHQVGTEWTTVFWHNDRQNARVYAVDNHCSTPPLHINYTVYPENTELRDLYSLPNIVQVVKSRRMRRAGHVARMGEGRGVHRVLVGKPEGKRPLGRPRRRW